MKKILMIEDDQGLAGLYKISLELQGYQVINTSDGNRATSLIETERPDLILLDIVLPGRSGLDILSEIKNVEDKKNIPVIIFTNFGNDENIAKALELGASDCIMKYRIIPDELVHKIAIFLGDKKDSAVKVTNV